MQEPKESKLEDKVLKIEKTNTYLNYKVLAKKHGVQKTLLYTEHSKMRTKKILQGRKLQTFNAQCSQRAINHSCMVK